VVNEGSLKMTNDEKLSESDSVEQIGMQKLRDTWLHKDTPISDFLAYLTEYQGNIIVFIDLFYLFIKLMCIFQKNVPN